MHYIQIDSYKSYSKSCSPPLLLSHVARHSPIYLVSQIHANHTSGIFGWDKNSTLRPSSLATAQELKNGPASKMSVKVYNTDAPQAWTTSSMKAQVFNDGRKAHTTKIAVTAMSAMAAETATFPVDLIKTRLQLHGESLVSSRRISAVRVVAEILRNDGILGLYKGLSPAIIRHMFYTPIRIVNYEFLRNSLVPADHTLSLSSKAIIGGISGVIAQVVASPADLVKVRMQADSRMASQGLQPRYCGPFDAFNKIIQTEGVRGLWKGVLPNVQRAFLVNMGELACYDHAKRFVINNNIANDNIYAHTLSSIMSGLSATTLSCPADVIKTRMMNQAADKQGNCKYKNSYDCLVKTIRVEGLKALWKGFFPTRARLGPWQFVFWVSYEKFRQIAGLSSF